MLRSPLLPFDEYRRWCGGGSAGKEAAGLEARLFELAARPELEEALFVASPSLSESLEKLSDKLPPKKVERLRQSLARYALRSMTRCTPFGLFAGSSLGTVGERTELRLGPRARYRRHTRLDMDYLFRLARDLEASPEVRPHLTYRPNSSLYRAAGRLRWAEGRLDGQRRTYHLVAASEDPYLAAALGAARAGASLEQIAGAILEADARLAEEAPAEDEAGNGGDDEALGLEEALDFVHELVDAQMLISDLGPRVTGPEPIHDLIERLSAIGEPSGPNGEPAADPLPGSAARLASVAEHLGRVRDQLQALDRQRLGSPAGHYRQLGAELEPFGTEVELPRLFQVDMTKPVETLILGPEVIEEVGRAVAFLHRVRGARRDDLLAPFREAFLRRYEPGRTVPLVKALDEEVGIGFERSRQIGSEHSPLLRGVAFPPPASAAPEVPWSAVQQLVLRKLVASAAAGQQELVFTDDEVEALPEAPARPLPDAFQAMFSLTASSSDALEQGDFRLLLKMATGPSGAVLLGRFCHGDPELERRVKAHFEREEALVPDAVFAEIVHLPEGRIGNILLRPVLRGYEIPFLGHSGAPQESQIPVDDLWVTVVGEQVLLVSKRLGKRVIPRFTSAHNYSTRGLGIYRFLCTLQHQGVSSGLSWHWGPFEGLPFLPRVVYGRTVLAPARWRVEKQELERSFRPAGKESAGSKRDGADDAPPGRDASDTELLGLDLSEIESWRGERGIPERVLLADGDNQLFVDFANPLTVEAFLAIVKNRPWIELAEVFQDEDGLVVEGPEGRFTHEIVLPFLRRPPRQTGGRGRGESHPKGSPDRRARTAPALVPGVKAHPPGSEWIYTQLYTGTSTADRLLAGPLADLVERFRGELDRWFFLRYADPEFHLRLRFRIPATRARHAFLDALGGVASQALGEGRIWDVRLDTYVPEQERYGGAEALELCERIFHADSRAVVAMLPFLTGDSGAEVRWLAALASVAGLTGTLLGDDADAEALCLEQMKGSFAREFNADAAMRKSLGGLLREKQKAIHQALEGTADPESPLGVALALLEARDRAVRRSTDELCRLEVEGRLGRPRADLAGSLAHMAVNRLIAAEPRPHEAVLYDFLHRHRMSTRARRRQEKKRRRAAKRS